MYKLIFIAFTLLLNHTAVWCQRYDFIWMNGYSGGKGDSRFGTSMMDFNEGNPVASFVPEGRLNIYLANASISDEFGQLLFYTNGFDVMSNNHMLVEGATDLGIKYWDGLIAVQGVLFLPSASNKNEHYLLYMNKERSSISGDPFFLIKGVEYLVLNSKNNKSEKNGNVIHDTINQGCMTACLHANGRDWWIIFNKYNTNLYYKYLLTPQGFQLKDTQRVGPVILDGYGQASFSPQGNYFALLEGVSYNEGLFIYLFNFDRCSGNLKFIDVANYGAKGLMGISFSPNEKYLYWSEGSNLYQMDLTSPDPVNYLEKVDSIIDVTPPWGSSYGSHQLAPDGRIYIINGHNNFVMHVIDRPNEYGKASSPLQNSFMLPTLTDRGTPNFPNYRLGPIDGSECDTLGIDNVPWAWWRYDQDTVEYRCFEFVDLSAYLTEESEPQWYWDLGDGTQSRDTSPVHCYQKDGVYEVCLMVKNKYGADTLCRTLHVGTSATGDAGKTILSTELFPNPATDHFVLNIHDYLPERMYLHLMNPQGQNVYTARLYQGSNFIDTRDLQPGVYSALIYERGILVKAEKLVVMRG